MCEVPIYRPLVQHAEAAEVAPLQTFEEMHDYAVARSEMEGVDPDIITSVIACESSWNPSARGDQGHSRGLVQIHEGYHPEISDEQADDPRFAINYLVEKIANNQGELWTCFRSQTHLR